MRDIERISQLVESEEMERLQIRQRKLMNITLADYVGVHSGSPDWTPARQNNAAGLLIAVNSMKSFMERDGVVFSVNPKTKSYVSGEIYGGFRPQVCPIGAPHSNHKEGHGIDIFDPYGKIDAWIMANQNQLVLFGICIEHPDYTITWSHWQDVVPPSGHHVYIPL